jgi:flavodoxin
MTRALVIHHSKTGRTRNYGDEIGAHLGASGVDCQVVDTRDFKPEMLEGVELLLLGCWTHGLMILFQHPDEDWVEFARALPSLGERRVALFTTYLIATGGMFRRMKKHLQDKGGAISLELRSRSASLSDKDREALRRFVAA